MVFQGDLHPGVEGLPLHGPEHGHGVDDPGRDAAGREPILVVAEDHAKGLRAERLRHADAGGEMLRG